MASNVKEIIYTRHPERSSQPSEALKYVPDEIAFDPYKLCLYNKAIRKGKVKEKFLRINIIGNYRQGKSSLAKSLIGQPSEDIASTNGIDIIRYKCHPTKEGIVTATQHDEADDGDLIALIATVARNVTIKDKEDNYDDDDDVDEVENKESEKLKEAFEPFEDTAVEDRHPTEIIPQSISNFQQTFDENEDITAVESNEKSASRKFLLSTDDYKKFVEAFEKENDDLGHQLEIWDFGGQFIFYSTHRLFHSKNALYLLVFDLTKSLDKTVRVEDFPNETGDRNMAYFARFWLESIDAYTGPDTKVILVGTHKDILKDPEQVKAYFENVRRLFEPADGDANNQLYMHIHDEDFAVDNKNSPNSGIKELLNCIITDHELVNVVEIPARWIELEKAIKRDREKKIITLQDVIDIDKNNKYPLEDIDQLKLFLSYQHNKGTFCFYDDGQITDAVVIVPQLLVNAIKCVITSEQFVKNGDERREWEKLKREGLLSEKLIEKKWSHDAIFCQHKDVIINFLVKQYILSPVKISQNRSNKPEVEYLVPCMLRSGVDTATKALKQFVNGKRQTQIRLLLKFSRPAVVQMVFHRLVAAVLGIWPLLNFCKEKLLYENVGVFEVLETNGNTSTNHAAVIQVAQDCGAIELRVVHLGTGELTSNVVGQVRRYIESFVEREFGSLTYVHRDDTKPFTRAYRCNHFHHTVDEKNTKDTSCTEDAGSVTIKPLVDLEVDEIRCPDNKTHTTEFYERAKKEWFSEDLDVKDFPPVSLTDKHISLCSQAIGENWELLAPHLSIQQTMIDHIKDDNKTMGMRIYSMLLKWKGSTCSESVTLEALVAALKKCSTVRVSWDVFKNIRDEFERTCSKETGFSRQLSINLSLNTVNPLSSVISRKLSANCVLFDTKLMLQCSVANPNSPVSWQKNGKDIISDNHFHISTQADQHILSIEHVVEDDSALYRCVCEGDVTECVVKVVKDSSNELEIIKHLEDTEARNTVVENSVIMNTAIFICELNKCTSDVRWIFSGKYIEQSDKFDLIDEGFVHKLRIKNVTEEDEGFYSIVAEGKKKSHARLYVEDTEEEKSLLQDYRQLRMVEGRVNAENETEETPFLGNAGQDQNNAGNGADNNGNTSSDTQGRVNAENETEETPFLGNAGQDSSNELEIIKHLEDTNARNTVVENSVIMNTAIFICELNKCTSDVRWIFSGKYIEQSDKFDLIDEGFVHKLRIKNVTEEDEGLYSIVAEGKKKSQARLYVEDTEEEKSLLQDYRQLRMVEGWVNAESETEETPFLGNAGQDQNNAGNGADNNGNTSSDTQGRVNAENETEETPFLGNAGQDVSNAGNGSGSNGNTPSSTQDVSNAGNGSGSNGNTPSDTQGPDNAETPLLTIAGQDPDNSEDETEETSFLGNTGLDQSNAGNGADNNGNTSSDTPGRVNAENETEETPFLGNAGQESVTSEDPDCHSSENKRFTGKKMTQYLSDEELPRLATFIGDNWQSLMKVLKLTQARIHQIERDEHKALNKITEALRSVKDKNNGELSLQMIYDAAKTLDFIVHIEWDKLIEDVKEGRLC